ncbi:MAG: hypothetical protein GY793_03615 [Proteobacteria bacterium]|nr:hypothetical protein [Pseudomonadota bacterium]
MDTLKNYFSQPSTYKGIAMLLSVFGIGVPISVQQAVCQAVVGFIGAWAVVRDEYKLSQLDYNKKKESLNERI